MSRFKASVIVVNYNCLATLQACIESILLSKEVGELLLVDNASTDESMDLVKTNTDTRLKIIPLNRNIGLASARNLAADRARYNYLVFTDADIAADPQWLQYPCLLLEKHKEFGAVQCKVLSCKNIAKIAHALAELNGSHWKDFSKEKPDSFYRILFPLGAGFLMRRHVWDLIKGFDPDFFVGNDDVDLGIRLWLSGYEVVGSPEGIVYHQSGTLKSRKDIAPIFQFYGLRNALFMWVKNLEGRTLARQVLPFSLLFPLLAFRLGGIMALKGLISFLTSLPSILVKRHEIQQLRKTSDDKIMSMMHSAGTLPIQLFTSDFQIFYSYILRRIRAIVRKFS